MRGVALGAAATLALALPAAAAEPPTIVAQPAIVGTATQTQLVLSGNVPSGQAGESVQIEAKDCIGTFFRVFGGATTGAGGAWSSNAFIRGNTTFRARWRDTVSKEILVQSRVFVTLNRGSRRTFEARVVTPQQRMGGKVVRLERLSPAGWVLVRTAKLRPAPYSSATARFKVVRRGLQLRVSVPQASARPCYAAGVSTIIRS
jgi:hypothetical protein